MARQGNYVNAGSGGQNWGGGLSSSLSDLSRSLLSQASEEKDREALRRREAEQTRQFELGYDRNLAKDAEAKRQFGITSEEAARINDSNIANLNQQMGIRSAKEQDRIAAIERDRQFQSSLKDTLGTPNYSLGDWADVQQTAFNRVRSALDGEREATAAYLSNPSEATRQNLLEASKTRLGLTTKGKGDANTAALEFVNSVGDHFNQTSVSEGLDVPSYLDELYGDDYARLDDTIRKGEGIPLQEKFGKFSKGLPDGVDLIEARNRFKEFTNTKSRSDYAESEIASINQAYEDAVTQAELYDKYYQEQRSGTSTSGGYKTKSGSDITNYESMLENDIGSWDNENRKNAYIALRETEGVTPDGAYAAILSMTDSNAFGTSFPNVAGDLDDSSTLLQRAKKFSGESKISFNKSKAVEDRYKVSRDAPTPIGRQLVNAINFAPSSNISRNSQVGALYDTNLRNERDKLLAAKNAEGFRPTLSESENSGSQSTESTNTQSTNTVPTSTVKELEAKVENSRDKYRELLKSGEDNVEAYRELDKAKKELNTKLYAVERIPEINRDIENLERVLARISDNPRAEIDVQQRINKLKEELKTYTP